MSLSQSIKKFLGFDAETHEQPEQTKQPESEAPHVPTDELTHINEEIYKKSAELSEKNKALSLLQKINELILGSITHPEEIAKQVVTILVAENDFEFASIYLFDKNKKKLKQLACARTNSANQENSKDDKELSLSNINNLIVQSVTQRKTLYSNSLENVFHLEGDVTSIKTVVISPLYVRNEMIGANIIGMSEEQANISDYRKLLLGQLAELIGIGIDNSLLYNEVQVSNERLKELDKLKDEFVSVASHELRTPMTAIKSYLWMALMGKGGDLNEKQKYYVQRGYNSVDRLIRLVNDMLNISRIESGRITIDLQQVNLLKITQDVVDEVMPRADELGVKVVMDIPDVLPPILADEDKIKEVLFNLIGNSLKFTPKDGSIHVSYSVNNGFIQVNIKDTGSGIDAEDISKLFQKFGLLPGSYTTNQPAMGTGLGLYICKSIVGLHKGKIWAESEGRGKGATFSFTVKVYTDADASAVNQERAEETEKVELIHSQV